VRKPALHLLALCFAVQTFAFFAHATERPEPKFKLAISLFQPGGAHSTFRKLRVTETNTSNEEFTEAGCLEFRGLFRISVLYNGVPLEEKDETARKEREAKENRTGCTHELGINKIRPGASWDRYLTFVDYNLSKPGSYEITVSRESELEHPEQSLVVKSNTITIVVPEPEAVEPK
jgi:hypothetical protein